MAKAHKPPVKKNAKKTAAKRSESNIAAVPQPAELRVTIEPDVSLDAQSDDLGPIKGMVKRLFDFRLRLIIAGHPQHAIVDKQIGEFLQDLMTAFWIFKAMQASPRRSVSGKNGALEHLGEEFVTRSSAYNFLQLNLGFHEIDTFRSCRTMEEVLERSPHLREQKEIVEQHYQELVLDRNPDAAPLFSELQRT